MNRTSQTTIEILLLRFSYYYCWRCCSRRPLCVRRILRMTDEPTLREHCRGWFDGGVRVTRSVAIAGGPAERLAASSTMQPGPLPPAVQRSSPLDAAAAAAATTISRVRSSPWRPVQRPRGRSLRVDDAGFFHTAGTKRRARGVCTRTRPFGRCRRHVEKTFRLQRAHVRRQLQSSRDRGLPAPRSRVGSTRLPN